MKLLIAGLIVVGFVSQSCTSAPETVQSQIKTKSSPPPKWSEIPPEEEKAIKLPPEKYEPNLKRCEEIVSSLKIEK